MRFFTKKAKGTSPSRAGLPTSIWFTFAVIACLASLPIADAQTYRSSASAGVDTGITSLVINKPTGTVSGDVMIASIAVRPDTATITPPSGWTLIRRTNQATANANAQATYWKAAGGSEPSSYTWTLGASPTGAAGGILSFYGVDTTTPVDVENGQATANSLSHATPSVTTTTNNAMLVTSHSFTSAATWTAPSGMTEAVDQASIATPATGGISIEINYVAQASAGATGTKTATAANDSDAGVAQILALNPNPDTTPPADVTDLATGTVTNTTIDLSWTAPGDDGATGTATSYDIRYSTSAINAGNWASATQVSGEPTPSAAGTSESFTVSGLSPSTTYYFAIKTSDEVPNESGVSNSPTDTTLADPTITQTGYTWSDDVSTFTSKGNDTQLNFDSGTTYILGIQVTLTNSIGSGPWTLQVRENGAGSWLNVYDLLGGNSPVWQTYDTHTFSKANGDEVLTSEFGHTNTPSGFTSVNGEFSDDNNGLTDGYIGTNIFTELQYAIRAESAAEGNTYEFRVVFDGAVLDAYDVYAQAADTTAPADITDLATGTVTSSSVDLSWTAPGDDGSTGTATTYDVRYSTSAITAGNWASATQATGEPSPSVAGTAESFTVSGLSASTTYYFAIKTSDEVPNESGVSNSPSATTSNLATGVLVTQSSDDAEEGNPPSGGVDLTSSDLELPNEGATPQEVGMRFQNITIPAGATITNAYIQFTVDETDSGATNLTFYGEDTDSAATFTTTAGNISGRTKTTASVAWNSVPAWNTVGANGADQRTPDLSTIIQEIVDRGGWASGNDMVIIVTGSGQRTAESWDGANGHGDLNLAPQLQIEYSLDSTPPADVTDLATGTVTNTTIDLSWTAPGDDGATGTATSYDIRYSTSAINAGNWASATQVSGEPTPSVAGSSESFTVTGLSPSTAYYFAIKTSDEVPNESGVSNSPTDTTLADPTITQTGYTWSDDVSTFTSKGNDTELNFDSATTYILGIQVTMTNSLGSGTWDLQVRENGGGSWLNVYDLSGGNSPVWQTYSTHTFSKSNGEEVLTGEFGHTTTPSGFTSVNGEFSDDNNGLTDGYIGTNIFTELQYAVRAEAAAEGNTYEFRVVFDGAVLNTYDVYAQAADTTAPADITDLATGTVTSSSVDLSWTAPGDDGSTGTATTYDIRYSLSPITAGNWASATQVSGEPSPSVAGTAESFTVTGLSASTTYYFAIKTSDEVPNESGVSNSPSGTTSAPAPVGVLVTQSSDDAEESNPPSGGMDLGSSDLELTDENGTTPQEIGMRFQGIAVPQGSTITNAYVQFTVDEVDSGATNLTFYGEDTDDAVTFTTTAGNVSGRTKTSASVAWNSVPAWDTVGEAGLDQRTPDLSSIIQEIVDRGGWASGNDIVILVTGTGERTAESWDGANGHGDLNLAPLLHVEYTNTKPIGGYTADDVIPTAQISQSNDGLGIVTINWKGKDGESSNVILNTFEYSVNGGSTWSAPTNADASGALSANWNDNGGAGWSTASTFAAATAHSFTFDTQHADVTGLAGVDQSDIQIRFKLNDGADDSANFVVADAFRVDNEIPTSTLTSGSYDDASDTLTLTGTNFLTLAAATTDIKTYVDWTKLVWDINGDDATTANITIAEADVTSLTVTDDTTLTLVFTSAKGTAIEATAGYGGAGGVDTLDVTAGFSKDFYGNASTTDGATDAPLTTSAVVSGTIYTDEGVTTIADGATVRLLINGVSVGTDTTVSGAYSIAPTSLSPGDAVVIYIDDDNGATNDATTVTVSDGADLSGLDAYVDRLIVRHDNGASLTNALMSTAVGAYSDTEILYTLDGSNNLTAESGTEIFIPSGHTYNPGANVTTQGATGGIDNRGTLTAGTSTFTVTGDWDSSSGTFNYDTSTVVLNGTGQTISGSNTFYNLTKSVASADTLTVAVSSTQTINGTVTLNGASGELLTLASSSPGTHWNFNVASGATKAISYVSVSWSDASGSDATQKPINPTNFTDGGDTVDWFGAPDLVVVKSSTTISDPINSTTNPKAIPGAIAEYSIVITNNGDGAADANTLVFATPVDSVRLDYDATTGVTFTDGATSSALALGTVTFSQTAAPGPYVYDYTPVPDGDGFDGNVTSIKAETTGAFAYGGSPNPSFTLKFRVRLK